MSRSARVLLVAVLCLDLVTASLVTLLTQASPTPAAARSIGPKVAIIVGPVGELTDKYRQQAEQAAVAARALTDRVVTVYSPDATWPAVVDALDGASIVVYLGHGYGWPSPYRDELTPRVQNGLGLNPVAGRDDRAHQYFGETFLARDVHLAPHAVVLLHHLCYASGNGEPGDPEPTIAVARERADNFAAGFIAAGADAVVAEGHLGPAYYVDALLRDRGTVRQIWDASPKFHGNVSEFASVRNPGFSGFLDPNGEATGFYRSLVAQPGASAAAMLEASGAGRAGSQTVDRLSLATRGFVIGPPALSGAPVAGSTRSLTLPVAAPPGELVPADLRLSTHWDPIDLDPEVPGASPAMPAPASPAAPTTPPAPASPLAPPIGSVDAGNEELIRVEQAGDVIVADPTRRGPDGLAIDLDIPAFPGLYRLVTTLHDGDGVALDHATQALIPALLVRVTLPRWASFTVPGIVLGAPGAVVSVPVVVTNGGTQPWGREPTAEELDTGPRAPGPVPLLVARIVSTEDPGPPASPTLGPTIAGQATVYAEPGQSVPVSLLLDVPDHIGIYLVVIDLVLPDGASLVANGVAPGLMRIVVRDEPAASDPSSRSTARRSG